MRYYWDHVAEKWQETTQSRSYTRERGMQLKRRSNLIADLIAEIEQGQDSVCKLYAQLLARSLVQSDELLMRDCGEQVAKLAATDKRKRPTLRNRQAGRANGQ
jgi:hypothetical protein